MERYLLKNIIILNLLLSLCFPTIGFAETIINNDFIQVDNVKVDGNTISSEDTNGNLILDPNGTGNVRFNDLTATTVPYLDASKDLKSSSVTPTELGYLSGVTSAIQTQIDAAATDTDLSTHISDTTTHGTTGDIVGTTDTQTLSAKTLTSPVINTGVSGTAILDEDNMASDSATQLATQQSIKAYVDNSISGAGGVPVGMVASFAAACPTGWLTADGTAVSRATYSSLYSFMGDAFGEGDGSTTFHLPDLRGKFLRGFDNTAGNDPDAASRTACNTGGNTGDNVGSCQSDQLKSHFHVISALDSNGEVGGSRPSFSGAPSTSRNTDSTGGNETRPKNVYVVFCIKH